MIPVYASHFPAGASSKQLWHFGYEMHCNYFGELMEMRPPMCPHPLPSFNLNSITTALSIFYSPTDPHTSKIDMETLHMRLTQANLAITDIHRYNHFDFIWAKNAAADIYSPLIARAEEFTDTNDHRHHHRDDNLLSI